MCFLRRVMAETSFVQNFGTSVIFSIYSMCALSECILSILYSRTYSRMFFSKDFVSSESKVSTPKHQFCNICTCQRLQRQPKGCALIVGDIIHPKSKSKSLRSHANCRNISQNTLNNVLALPSYSAQQIVQIPLTNIDLGALCVELRPINCSKQIWSRCRIFRFLEQKICQCNVSNRILTLASILVQ